MRTIVWVALAAVLGGCAATPPEQQTAPELPTPSDFHISGSIDLNLTPQMSIETGLPASMKITLDTTAHAEAVSAAPMHSKQNGHLALLATDGTGTKHFVDINLDVTGDQAGTPDQALVVLITRFLDAASLMTQPVTATSRPAR